jgi:Ca-activated chloride channel homolog
LWITRTSSSKDFWRRSLPSSRLLADIATKGWSAVGGQAEWGKLKLAQSNPALSNSGMMALTLMFQEYKATHGGGAGQVNIKGFMERMAAIEGATGGKFADTTSKVIDDAANHDVAIIYESDAVQEIGKGLSGVRIVYPSPTATAVLPAAVVEGTWVNDTQKELGDAFVDYLLSPAVQEKAIAMGYRPAIESLSEKVDEFYSADARASKGMKRNPELRKTFEDSRVKEGLIFNWTNWYKNTYNKDPIATGG